jgi:hypothetical protein
MISKALFGTGKVPFEMGKTISWFSVSGRVDEEFSVLG